MSDAGRARRALAELERLRCDDPAAAPAMRVVRLTVLTLRWFWLPALAPGPHDGTEPDP